MSAGDLWRANTHRRFDPLARRWVLVSPHRTDRPWLGEVMAETPPAPPAYDPHCYLCPGNVRANGDRNPDYASTFVFDNDYPALLTTTPPANVDSADGLFAARSERGHCRVLCFSPRHDLHLAQLPHAAVRAVVDLWAEQYARLGSEEGIQAVTVFENRGAMMGASNPHPHAQLWAESEIPNELATETASLQEHRARYGTCLLCAYARAETAAAERIVYQDGDVVAVVPFWAVWPFELLVLPRAHVASLDAANDRVRDGFARALADVTARYDRLFGTPFPYTMGVHQRPCDARAHDEWHAHAHYYPPLLRSATVRKYMVGYEMLAQPQRDITAETAAERLRTA